MVRLLITIPLFYKINFPWNICYVFDGFINKITYFFFARNI